MKAGQDGEKAVEAGNFVEQERERDQLCTGTKTHQVEESLCMSATVQSLRISIRHRNAFRVLEEPTFGRGRRSHLVKVAMLRAMSYDGRWKGNFQCTKIVWPAGESYKAAW